MSHEITSTDKVLSVREYAWHGLEQYSEDYLSLAETRKIALDWDVIREPVYRKVIGLEWDGKGNQDLVEHYELINEFELNTRTDNGAELAVVPTGRADVSVTEMFDLAEVVQGADKNVLIETAGSLRGGRDAFILIRLNEPIEIRGDKHGTTMPFLALQNSWEPGASFRVQATNVRIVCKNTSRSADVIADSMGLQLAFSHTMNMAQRIEEAKTALAAWREDIAAFKNMKEVMAVTGVTTEGVSWFVDQFISEPPVSLTTDKVKLNIATARLELIGELFNPMTEGLEMTALGLFEAASSWNEHVRAAATPLTRFKRSTLSPTTVLADASQLAWEATTI